MKIRSGFISNSSTCSFVVMGFGVEENFDTRGFCEFLSGKELDEELGLKEGEMKNGTQRKIA